MNDQDSPEPGFRKPLCPLPPVGWCSRDPDHPGPCAARRYADESPPDARPILDRLYDDALVPNMQKKGEP
jgi:hypothetical protein